MAGSLAFKSFVQGANSQDKSPELLFSYSCIQCNVVHCNPVHSYGIFISALDQKAQPTQKNIGSNRFSFFFPNFVLVRVFHYCFLNIFFYLGDLYSFKKYCNKKHVNNLSKTQKY